jgi:hypothetical protein
LLVTSAGASFADLATSETFSMEIRANAIAYVYSVGTLVGVNSEPRSLEDVAAPLSATSGPGSARREGRMVAT